MLIYSLLQYGRGRGHSAVRQVNLPIGTLPSGEELRQVILSRDELPVLCMRTEVSLQYQIKRTVCHPFRAHLPDNVNSDCIFSGNVIFLN